MRALSIFGGWRPGRGGVLSRRGREDRGAVATVFAVLVAGGVLLGMAALTVDVGRLYVEREELQSGADAAAMAIMEECARADIAGQECSVDDALAEFLANGNAKDGAANVMEICGNIPNSTTLPACTPPVGNLTDCIPGEYAGTRPYLEVRTGTRSPENEYLLPPTLAQTLLGNGDYVGTEVRACARASYGAPAQGFAVTFSECEYDAATNGGTDFPDAPPYPPNDEPDPSYEVVLKTHDSQTNPPACGAGPAGGDGPGGFGWLTEEIDPCQSLYPFAADPGNNTTSVCLDALDDAIDQRAILYIPIFQDLSGTGANLEYDIIGMSAFVPTGYFFGTNPLGHRDSWLNPDADYCSGQDRCLFGYFVNDFRAGVPVSDTLDSFGATVIGLVG